MANPDQKQNLINQVTATKIEMPPGFYKSSFFDFLILAAAFGFGYFYHLFLRGETGIYSVVISIAVYAIFLGLRVFLAKSFGRFFLVLLLQIAAMLWFFYATRPSWILGLSAGIMLALSFWGEMLSQSELKNGLEIKFFKTARQTIGKFVTAALLVMIILYLPQWKAEDIFFSEKGFKSLFGWAAGVAGNFYPELNFNSTVGDLAESVARFQLRGSRMWATLPPSAQEQAIKAATSQVIGSLGGSLGVAISAKESVSQFFYDLILKTLNRWHVRYGSWFLFVWALTVFFATRALGVIFGWLVSFVAFAVYQLLLAFGVIRISLESRAKETVDFS